MTLIRISRAIRLLGVLLTVSMIAACGGVEARYASHLQRGKEYLERGNLSKASIELRNALQIEPKAAEALYLNGTIAERRGNMNAAVAQYQAAIEAKPDFVAAAVGLGRLFLLGGAPDRAAAVVSPLILKHPDDPDLLTVRSAARFRLGDKAGALADAQSAVSRGPRNVNAVELLAGLYRDAGASDKAVGLVTEALKRTPASANLREVLARLYIASGQPARAEQVLSELIALRPDELTYRALLVSLYVGQHRIDEAQGVLEEAVRSRPADDRVKIALANFVALERSPQQGETMLRTFVRSQPKDYDLGLALGSLLRKDGALQDAVAAYTEVIKGDAKGVRGLIARDQIAEIEVARGNLDVADQTAGEVLKADPRDDDALSVRADVEMARGNNTAAVGDLRAILRESPTSVDVLRRLANAYARNDQLELAQETLQSALNIAPQESSVRDSLSELLLEMNRPQQVVALSERALAKDPNDAAATAFLIRADVAAKNFDAAATTVRELNSQHPTLASGPYLAGIVAVAQGQLDVARGDFERAVRMQPRAADALTALVDLDSRTGRTGAALDRLKALVATDPDNAVAQELYGRVLTHEKAYPAAIAHLTRATLLAPKWLPSYLELTSAEVASADVSGAVGACEAGLKQFPWNPELTTDLTSLYERQGRTSEAIMLAEALHAHRPDVPIVAKNLALLLVSYRGDQVSFDRARDLVSVFRSSKDPALLDAFGWVHVKTGDPASGLEALRRAVQESPNSALFRFHLGIADWKLGHFDEARASLEAALMPDVRFAGIDQARAVLASLKSPGG